MLCPSFDKWNGGLGSTRKGNYITKYIFETIESMTWEDLLKGVETEQGHKNSHWKEL